MSYPFRLALASNNPGKLKEMKSLFEGHHIELVFAPDVPSPDEDGSTFVANALIKALAWAKYTGLPALADDSGLVVDALGGAPGVWSARFAEPVDGETQTQANNNKLLNLMNGVSRREAAFRCVLVLAIPRSHPIAACMDLAKPDLLPVSADKDHITVCCNGTSKGKILRSPTGESGFGFDPLFLSDDLGVSFAEASGEAKNRVSHRGRAVSTFLSGFFRPLKKVFDDEFQIESYPDGRNFQIGTGIKVTHIPSGVFVIEESERSQHKNKARALERIQAVVDLKSKQ